MGDAFVRRQIKVSIKVFTIDIVKQFRHEYYQLSHVCSRDTHIELINMNIIIIFNLALYTVRQWKIFVHPQ